MILIGLPYIGGLKYYTRDVYLTHRKEVWNTSYGMLPHIKEVRNTTHGRLPYTQEVNAVWLS